MILIINAVWAIPLVFLVRCLCPIKIIRFGPIRSDRIGHFAADAGQQWAMRKFQSRNFVDLYWMNKITCNKFWEKMVRRNFHVSNWVYYLDKWNNLIPGGTIHHRPSSTTGSRDIYGYLERCQEPMSFLPEEDKEAKKFLFSLGWKEGEPFTCLLVRDSHYLNHDPLHKDWAIKNQTEFGSGWDYHNYRDSDIATYVPAAEWLADQGVWVLRMGKSMAKPIPSSHPKVIDYAFHPERSDFLDVWLFAHCDFCISTGTGPDAISDVYRRPLLFVNYLPIMMFFSWSDAIHVPKNLIWKDKDYSLTIQEHFDNNYLLSDQYQKAGIRIVDLDQGEILSAVKERWQRINGEWIDLEQDIKLQNIFREILKRNPGFCKYHNYIHFNSKIGSAWINDHKSHLLGHEISV